MKKDDLNYATLVAVFVTALVVANILASKVLAIGPLEVPAAIIAYPITFLITDTIGEIWGKKHAQRAVYIGIMCQIISLILICIAVYAPAAPYMTEFSAEYKDVLLSTARIVFASMVGFIASQTCDVYVFHRLKDNKATSNHKWIRNNVSTTCSQAVDTCFFVILAFWGTGVDIVVMILSQLLIKWIIAMLDTPIFYLCTRDNISN